MRRAGLLCVVLMLALVGEVLAAASASAADRVYWANYYANKISFANLDGSGGGDLNTTGATPLNRPQGVAVDPAAGRIYWANAGGNKISFANVNGTGGGGDLSTSGATALNSPDGVAIDPAAGRIYWANENADKISFAKLNGTGGGDLNTGSASVNGPEGVAADPAAGRIYWANGVNNKISFAKLDGTGGSDLNTGTATVKEPWGVAVDPAAGRIYWANYVASKISFANLNGSGGGDLSTTGATASGPAGVAVDPAADRIYWANHSGNKISFANVNGTGGAGDLSTSGATALNAPVLPALLETPSALTPPAVAGATAPPAQLSCAPAAWAGDLTPAFLFRAPQFTAYQWLRDGTAIPGAAGSSYTATIPGNYSCLAGATNAAGASTQISATHPVLALAKIKKAKINKAKHSAKFTFQATAGASGLQCALIKRKHSKKNAKPRFKRCKSPKTYKHLKHGTYIFELRAFSTAGPGPIATKRFKI